MEIRKLKAIDRKYKELERINGRLYELLWLAERISSLEREGKQNADTIEEPGEEIRKRK